MQQCPSEHKGCTSTDRDWQGNAKEAQMIALPSPKPSAQAPSIMAG